MKTTFTQCRADMEAAIQRLSNAEDRTALIEHLIDMTTAHTDEVAKAFDAGLDEGRE